MLSDMDGRSGISASRKNMTRANIPLDKITPEITPWAYTASICKTSINL